jgi:hypothetical protein
MLTKKEKMNQYPIVSQMEEDSLGAAKTSDFEVKYFLS